jgi:hypothetical protein
MLKAKTYFEQVPLEIVKKIVEEEMPPEAVTERHRGTSRKTMAKNLRGTHKQSKTDARRSSQVELSE